MGGDEVAEQHGRSLREPGAGPIGSALASLRGVLDAWIESSNDQGRTPEPPSVLEYWEERMRKNYDKRLREREARKKRSGP